MPVSSTMKAIWTAANHEIFLDLCLDETLKGNKPGSHFTKEGWSNIIESYYKNAGVRYDKSQMKNHWDLTKRQWKYWANPEAAQFQFKELQSIDKLEIIFDGTVESGEMEPVTCLKRQNSSSVTPVKHEENDFSYDTTAVRRAAKIQCRNGRTILKNHWDGTKEQWKIWHKLVGTSIMKWDPDINEFGAGEEAWENYLKRMKCHDNLTASTLQTEKPDILQPDNFTASTLHTEKPDNLQPEGTTDSQRDLVESSSAVTFQKQDGVTVPSTQSKLTFSIGECIDSLDGLEELEQGSDLYLFALDVFLKKEYREIFLQLKRPSVKISWLQRLQAVDQPLQ
ncbi:Myb/SANT-like domain containing protein [Trema orientale]|uniref:Myb/SANT-like domain containing protein n=1 Tax=Trema orientale TaxID=63057 RepID=A0A2P5ENR2_TREOI|nr:Myb/SANT-like domain containing protein [Trema orientale]